MISHWRHVLSKSKYWTWMVAQAVGMYFSVECFQYFSMEINGHVYTKPIGCLVNGNQSRYKFIWTIVRRKYLGDVQHNTSHCSSNGCRTSHKTMRVTGWKAIPVGTVYIMIRIVTRSLCFVYHLLIFATLALSISLTLFRIHCVHFLASMCTSLYPVIFTIWYMSFCRFWFYCRKKRTHTLTQNWFKRQSSGVTLSREQWQTKKKKRRDFQWSVDNFR